MQEIKATSVKPDMKSPALFWFTNDLRLHDNPALLLACSQAEQILPVFIFDEHWEQTHPLHCYPKMGNQRKKFLLESLIDLKKSLRAKGSDLLFVRGKAKALLPHLIQKHQCSQVFLSTPIGFNERNRLQYLQKKLPRISFHTVETHPLVPSADLPFDIQKLPEVFTPFRKKIEKYCTFRAPEPTPERIPTVGISDWGSIPSTVEGEASYSKVSNGNSFLGGERAALKQLNAYLWDKDLLKSYKLTRNGLLGWDYSSKFSPWLALGCLSPRFIVQEIGRYETKRVKNQSTYWLIFELLWRDFFQFMALKYGAALFRAGGLKNKTVSWSHEVALFERWRTGQTGISFVDANMRELLQTGFMSNRGRQIVASFLTKNLKIDWRWGASWFESALIDYDVASNWGNWAYVSGVGNDPRNRYFNIVSQGKTYDSQGDYVRAWIPELTHIQGFDVHLVHEKPDVCPPNYPHPIVHLESSYPKDS